MFNRVVIVGNISRDIELRYTQSGSAIASTAIATTHKYTSNGERKEEVTFIDITFFGKSAEIANQYLRKGSKCLVEGRLKLDQWQDQSGNKRSKHGIVVEKMVMLDNKQDNQQQAPQQQVYTAYQAPQTQQQPQQMPEQLPGIDIDPDEIPF